MAVLAPMLAAERPRPIEFISVQIVPAAVLGTERPAPRRAPPEPAPPPAEEPPPAPEPEPEPPDPELPALPAEEEPEPREEPPPPRPEPPRPEPPREEPAPISETAAGEPGRAGSPTGSPTGSSAFGAEVAGLDNPDFTYGYYIDQMLGMIRQNWVRPPLGGGIEATVYFRIQRDGRVTGLRVATSSGYNSFDLAGLRAVQSASPFPPLPRGFAHDSLGVHLIIR